MAPTEGGESLNLQWRNEATKKKGRPRPEKETKQPNLLLNLDDLMDPHASMGAEAKEIHGIDPRLKPSTQVLFSSKKNYKIVIVPFSFVFDKYYPVMD